MIELIPNSGIYAAPIAKDQFDFRFHFSSLYEEWVLCYKSKTIWEKYGNECCNWKVHFEKEPVIICTTANASEEDAAKVVQTVWGGFAGHIKGYMDYELIGCDIQPLKKATDSLSSLLRSLNLTEPNYLIIKKEMV